MENWNDKPLNFGEILDVTFHIIKKYFAKLFLIMLILTGPMYLIQGLAYLSGGVSIFGEPMKGPWLESWIERMEGMGMETVWDNIGLTEVILIIGSMVLLNLISIPLADASMILATNQIKNHEKLDIWLIIKRAFSRFWALLGGSIVYFLITIALFTIVALIIFLFISATETINNPWIQIPSIVSLSGASIFIITYLLIRWSFYFAPILFEKVSPGLSKSWKLTRGHFWRLIRLFIVLWIILAIFSSIIQSGVQLLLGNSVISSLLNNLLSMLTMMISFIAYAVIYFDLRLRNEAADLKEMVEAYHSEIEEKTEGMTDLSEKEF